MQHDKSFRFESPALYRIRVQGHIDEHLSEVLGGMIITRAFSADGKPLTILVGRMGDQAALAGVLNELYEMHLPLLTVESIHSAAGPASAPTNGAAIAGNDCP